MDAYIAYRYPNQEAFFLGQEETGTDIFRFQSFDNSQKQHIIGSSLPYVNQLEQHGNHGTIPDPHIAEFSEYAEQFKQFQQALKTGKTQKAILSRIIAIPIHEISLHALFQLLCQAYEKALVYVAFIPNSGIWVGASPERLVKFGDKVAKTVALAGTNLASVETPWTQKEIIEHRYVEQFYWDIERQYPHFGIIDHSEAKTAQAGHLVHLKSAFSFEVADQQRQEFLEIIHPTPAVAGYPRQDALALIEEIETHERHYYTGFLGLSNSSREEYFVNLRCMQLTLDTAYVYVGGGLTIDSQLEQEWEETINKSHTMSNILSNIGR